MGQIHIRQRIIVLKHFFTTVKCLRPAVFAKISMSVFISFPIFVLPFSTTLAEASVWGWQRLSREWIIQSLQNYHFLIAPLGSNIAVVETAVTTESWGSRIDPPTHPPARDIGGPKSQPVHPASALGGPFFFILTFFVSCDKTIDTDRKMDPSWQHVK